MKGAVLTFLIFCCFTHPALAQDSPAKSKSYRPYETPAPPNMDTISNPYYDHFALQALDMPERFEFGTLRNFYTRTDHYDPLGEEARARLLDMAYIIQNETDQDRRVRALEVYRNTVINHLANMGVVMQALALSREDRRLGNPDFFIWMRNGLLQDLLGSGTGYNLHQAYDALTVAEEPALLNHLGVKVLNTEAVQESVVYYNMHEVEDRETGRKYTIFVDVSRPMRYMEEQALRQENTFSIERQ